MGRVPGIVKSAGAVLVAGLMASCGIRLPDTPVPQYHVDVARQANGSDKADGELVWLISDEIHTGMAFHYDWLLESGFVPPKGFGRPKFVTLSWGNRTAYVEKGLHSPWKFCRALFAPSPSVMELIPTNWNIPEVCPHQRIWRKLVERGRGRDLAAFLNDCSIRGSDGRPNVVGTSSWGGGVLLESRHVYFIPRICNIWTGQVIESMGGKIHPWGAITADSLVWQAEHAPNNYEQIWWGIGKDEKLPLNLDPSPGAP